MSIRACRVMRRLMTISSSKTSFYLNIKHMLFIFVLPALILLALLAYTKPQVATILLIALTPIYLIKFSVASIPTNLFEISILIVFSFSAVQLTVRKRWRENIRQTPPWIIIFIAIFVISSIISTLVSPHPKTSLGILKGWIITPLLIGWLAFTFNRADKTNNFHAQALRSLVITGLVVSFFGLIQINQLDRVRSIYDVSNSLALFVTPLLIITFYLTIVGHRRAFYLPSTIIIGSALIATQSISGITAAAISMLIGTIVHYFSKQFYKTGRRCAPVLKSKKTLIFSLTLFTLFTVASLSVITTTGRLSYLVQPWKTADSYNSISVRLQLWSISLKLIKDHPFLGVGLGTFEPAYQQALHARFNEFHNCKLLIDDCDKPLAEFVYRDPHNWPLSFWLNTGLVGLLCFTAINIFIIWKAITQLLSSPHNPSRVFATATILALVSLLLFGLTDTIYWKNDLSALHWILMGLLLGAS